MNSYDECVILLHGLARTARSMARLAAALRDAGYRVVNVDYPSRKYDIATLATLSIGQTLARENLARCARLHFVTHSLGGILVRHYLKMQRPANLGRVVMLAPPNQGSEVVDAFRRVPGYAFINGPAGFELGTRDDSVPRHLGAVDYPVGVIAGTRSVNPILSTALPSPDDGKVSLTATQVEGMHDFLSLPVAHPFIMRNGLVIAEVLHFLAIGAFRHDAKPS